MKKTTARLISILTLLCLLLNALGCSDSDEGVSASVVQILVEESEYYEGSNGLSVTTIHDYDDEANIDNADIKMTYQNKYGQYSVQCSAVYEYDRSSDLWSLVRAGEWSDPQYEFSDNLIGEWIFPSFSKKSMI